MWKKRIPAIITAIIIAFSFAGCKRDQKESEQDSGYTPGPDPVEIRLTGDKTGRIALHETVKLTAEVKNTDEKECIWTVTGKEGKVLAEDYAYIDDYEGGKGLFYETPVEIDTVIYVTAASKKDKSKSESLMFILAAPVVEGRVGDLTSAMIEEISNPSITVTGTLTDVYTDVNNDLRSHEESYDMEVKMSEGAWTGSWAAVNEGGGAPYRTLSDTYRRSDKKVYNKEGALDNALERVYINRNNKVTHRTETGLSAYPSVWSEQHLWNHLNGLNVNRFLYDPIDEVYEYKLDVGKNSEDAFFATYLAVSLTPLLEDTFAEIYLTVDKAAGKIDKLIAKTATIKYGETQQGSYDAISYTKATVSFSGMGTTVVKEPVPYEAPVNADTLQSALDSMAAAENYTFSLTESRLKAPAPEEGEFGNGELRSKTSGGIRVTNLAADSDIPRNYRSQTGTLGVMGLVTEDGILLGHTDKYEGTMDNINYHTEYDGFRKIDGNTYESFEYFVETKLEKDEETGQNKTVVTDKGYRGKNIRKGRMLDEMPGFGLSANIFDYDGLYDVMTGGTSKKMYRFTLKEPAITKEVARQLCINWKNAVPATEGALEVYVTESGELYSSKFYYDIAGAWFGTLETVYGKVGKTKLHEKLFDAENYRPRVTPSKWSDTVTKYFTSPDKPHSYDENTQVVLDSIFTAKEQESLPTLSMLLEMFGDNINGPFYDEIEAEGGKQGKITVNSSFDNLDEDGYEVQCFTKVADKIDEVMTANGFLKDRANSTDLSAGESGRSDIYLTYYKDGGVEVVFENNHTRHVWMSIYKLGAWRLD